MMTADDPAAAPASAQRSVRVELTESRAGWALVVTLDRPAAAAIGARLSAGEGAALADAGLRVSIMPNLVPGQPFPVDSVTVVISD